MRRMRAGSWRCSLGYRGVCFSAALADLGRGSALFGSEWRWLLSAQLAVTARGSVWEAAVVTSSSKDRRTVEVQLQTFLQPKRFFGWKLKPGRAKDLLFYFNWSPDGIQILKHGRCEVPLVEQTERCLNREIIYWTGMCSFKMVIC